MSVAIVRPVFGIGQWWLMCVKVESGEGGREKDEEREDNSKTMMTMTMMRGERFFGK